jgi:hypothetical protein
MRQLFEKAPASRPAPRPSARRRSTAPLCPPRLRLRSALSRIDAVESDDRKKWRQDLQDEQDEKLVSKTITLWRACPPLANLFSIL